MPGRRVSCAAITLIIFLLAENLMKLLRPIILFLLVLSSCSERGQDKNQKQEIPKGIESSTLPGAEGMVLASSAQALQYKLVSINGSVFLLSTRNNDTIYIATSDTSFKTEEGFRVGMTISELPFDVQMNLHKENGWAYYYTLPSGWSLAFFEGESGTETAPKQTSKVSWIFKRRF